MLLRLLVLFISSLASLVSYAQPRNRVEISTDPAIRQEFTPLDSMRIAYSEFDEKTGVLLKSGQLLRYHVDSSGQVEDPLTHLYHFVNDTVWNVKDGLWTEYYPGGKKRLECSFSDRAIIGVYTTWYENGNIDSTGYLLGYSTKKDNWNYYYPDGKKKREETYLPNDGFWATEATLDFRRVDYYPDGSIKQAEQFDTNGNRVGEFFAFYPGNKLKQYGIYVSTQKWCCGSELLYYTMVEIKYGLWITFDVNEKIKSVEGYNAEGISVELPTSDRRLAEEKGQELLKNKAAIISRITAR